MNTTISIRVFLRCELENMLNHPWCQLFTRDEILLELERRDYLLEKRRDTAGYPELGNSFH